MVGDASDLGFQLLYEKGACLVVSKPGGLLTQAPPGIDSLEVRVKKYLARDGQELADYLGVPHRLDRPASGALVLSKSSRGARLLSEQFQGRLVQKTYWAIVEGIVEPDEGPWRDFVKKVPDKAMAEVVDADTRDARVAELNYRVLVKSSKWSWLEIELETGRTHQVRVQSSSRSHPILGDAMYGASTPFGPACSDARDQWIALHARSLAFRHPKSRSIISVVAPLPAPWQKLGLREQDVLRGCYRL